MHLLIIIQIALIFRSFFKLKECIRALDLDSKHTPFRQSKLTQVGINLTNNS